MQRANRSRGVTAPPQQDHFDFYRAVFNELADGVVVSDAQGTLLDANAAFCRMFGFHKDELIGLGAPYPFWPPEEIATIRKAFEAALKGGDEDYSLRMCRKSGERFPVFVHPAQIRLPESAERRFAAVFKDATEHKRLERARQRSEERWRSIAENPYDFVAIFDRNYRYQYANHSAPGFCLEEVLGTATPFDFVDPKQHDAVRAAFERTFREGAVSTYEVFVPANQHWYANVVTPIKEDGEVTAVSVLTRDVTEQKRALDRLRESERHLQLALAAGDLGTFECDLARGTWLFSPRLYEMWGYAPGSPEMPRDLSSFIARVHPEDAPGLKEELMAGMQTGMPIDLEYRIRRASGEYAWLQARARMFREADGSARLYGLVSDISARKRAEAEHARIEAQLRHAQKMDTLGTLAGGIAHDFNNILTPILGNAELLGARLEPHSPLARFVTDISAAAHRAQELVSRILVFGRSADEQHERVCIPRVAREALRLVSSSLPPSVRVLTHFEDDLPEVWGSSGQIYQAITNVLTNAYQALRVTGGTLELRVELAALDEFGGQVAVSPRAVRVSVADDGPGIPPELRERIFEPFFTTKRVGEGTGLGLSLVHSIMKRHGGSVALQSQPRGARFDLYFPLRESSTDLAPQREQAASPVPGSGGLRVLCVDDDVAVLTAIEAMLGHSGHRVTALSSPREALDRVLHGETSFDLVITDQTMPQLTGLELARALEQLRPGLPVLLMSGYADIAGLEGRPSNLRAVLQKPMTLPTLLAAVRASVS